METPTGLRSIRPDTWLKIPLVMVLGLIGGVAAIVWSARGRLADLEFEQRATKSLVGDLPRRDELVQLERRLTAALQRQLKHALLKCPRRAARGDAWMECQVVFPRPDGETP